MDGNGNTTLDESVNRARQSQHRSLARELSGTTKEVLGTARSVGRSVDGRHPRDITDDVNGGAVERPASEELKGKYLSKGSFDNQLEKQV